MTPVTCERHAKKREQMKRLRADPAYRERERQHQHGYKTSERSKSLARQRYVNMSGYDYSKLLLRHRRNKALARMAQRHLPKEEGA